VTPRPLVHVYRRFGETRCFHNVAKYARVDIELTTNKKKRSEFRKPSFYLTENTFLAQYKGQPISAVLQQQSAAVVRLLRNILVHDVEKIGDSNVRGGVALPITRELAEVNY